MKIKKEKRYFKYGIFYKGPIDLILINNLRSKIIANPTKSLCKNKQHCRPLKGTISKRTINEILNDNSDCCKKFIIIDKDKIPTDTINKLKSCKKITLILSEPCMEIILYSIFNKTESILTKEIIEYKLNEKLKQYKIKYNHDPESAKKIFDIFDDNENLKENWIKNIEELNKDNKSNLIEFINFLKEK